MLIIDTAGRDSVDKDLIKEINNLNKLIKIFYFLLFLCYISLELVALYS
ncbi:MAG: hypothetical protein IIA49_16745 [Bacteroidetes bacterium]|nr:hypothetical protein [Bacteroidota bacterium]